MDYKQIVSDAAKWLDEVEPGWWRRIDTEELDLWDCKKCILGQLRGHFDNIFLVFSQEIASGGFEDAFVLNYECKPYWLNEISSRLEADKSSESQKVQERFVEYTKRIINEKVEEPCLTNAS